MFVNVDCTGIEAVCRMIQQTGLKRFIVYRQGYAKGSVPVYDCTHTNNNVGALKCFRDWASNMNPNSGMCYDILLFNTDADESDATRKDKVRFSFSLGNFMPGQHTNHAPAAPQVDIQAEINRGIEVYMLKHRIKELEETIDEMEEDEEEEEPDMVDKIAGIISALQQTPQHADAVSGDKLDDNEMVTEKLNGKFTPEQIAKKNENVKTALRSLWKKNSALDEDLLRLAKMADTNPILFKMTIAKLRDMIKL